MDVEIGSYKTEAITRKIYLIWLMTKQGRIQRGLGTGQPVWDPRFLSQFNKKLKILK